jgi:hypothetical protein
VAVITVFCCVAIFTLGCKKNCSSTACHTYEVCNSGVCYCPNGKEGDSCKLFSANKYIQPYATWQVSDQCSGNASYYVNISVDQSTYYFSRINLNGFFGGGYTVYADIISNASHQGINLNIPEQNVGSGTISGQGFYQVNGSLGKITLNLDYIQYSGIESNCTVLLYQQ